MIRNHPCHYGIPRMAEVSLLLLVGLLKATWVFLLNPLTIIPYLTRIFILWLFDLLVLFISLFFGTYLSPYFQGK